MSESRRADITLRMKGANGVAHKFELFRSAQFTRVAFTRQSQACPNGVPTIRMRHNGVWLPLGEQTLMTLDEALKLIHSVCARNLRMIEES